MILDIYLNFQNTEGTLNNTSKESGTEMLTNYLKCHLPLITINCSL